MLNRGNARFWFSIILTALLLTVNSSSQQQTQPPSNSNVRLDEGQQLLASHEGKLLQENIALSATGGSSSPNISSTTSILFTGKLMGYFRLPNRQSAAIDESPNRKPCKFDYQSRESTQEQARHEIDPVIGPSLDAAVFLDNLPTDQFKVLVGMGDNFAPNYFSRVFYETGQNQPPQKELNSWNGAKWVRYDSPDANTAEILQGNETIPTDNVACFLARAGYDAIVPGKHDFYYGPQRLRALARFLASIPGPPEPGKQPDVRYHPDFHPVQMLAANLMIKTSWVKDHEAIPDNGKPELLFTDKFKPLAPQKGTRQPHTLEIVDFTDRGYAFPWMRFVRVNATGWGKNFLQNSLKVHLCQPSRDDEDQDPDELLPPNGSCGEKLRPHEPAIDSDGTVHLVYELPDFSHRKYPNYAICVYDPGEEDRTVPAATEHPYCLRFSLYQPYFQYPDWPDNKSDNKLSSEGTVAGKAKYQNPLPYVLKGEHVVIFGVVDPKLGEHIGADNFAWEDVKPEPVADPPLVKRYTTQLTVADPVQALIQINDLFEHEYGKTFHGLRLLLAQMPADQAKQLPNTFPDA